jgi:hypothetical protein
VEMLRDSLGLAARAAYIFKSLCSRGEDEKITKRYCCLSAREIKDIVQKIIEIP